MRIRAIVFIQVRDAQLPGQDSILISKNGAKAIYLKKNNLYLLRCVFTFQVTFIYAFVWVCVCHHGEIRKQLVGVSSLLPPCGSWGSNRPKQFLSFCRWVLVSGPDAQ